MNKNKILQDIELFEKQKTDLIKQFKKYLKEYGPFLEQEYRVRPNAKKFANWFIDNYQDILRKKRRTHFYLNFDYVLTYCHILNEELHRRKKMLYTDSSVLISNHIYEYEHFDTILNYLIELFNHDKYANEELVFDLAKEASEILRTQKSLKRFEVINRDQLSTRQENIRYCYFQFYELNKKPHIRKLFIDYLLEKFKCFSEVSYNTTHKHFKYRHPLYPL